MKDILFKINFAVLIFMTVSAILSLFGLIPGEPMLYTFLGFVFFSVGVVFLGFIYSGENNNSIEGY